MSTVSYTEAGENLASLRDETVSTREPVALERRRHESVLIVPIDEWNSVLETAHLPAISPAGTAKS
ncbi:MAG: type II toxin-antitoxin system Phd/YefM family antitoxin [Puniceicoccales bacterium]|jgi:PHD/YefM family antitoxin component YafN of YafNO toxin-antitoxin module|nr:type II toxin-antitoxin system Phd/YefM family antitoxin [Puniceicoccales bacterium]